MMRFLLPFLNGIDKVKIIKNVYKHKNLFLNTFQVKDDNDSETSEEFTLEDDDEDNDEDVSHIFMAPTLACDDVEDSNQSEPIRDGIQEMETQAIGECETQAVGEGETQAVGEDQTQVKFLKPVISINLELEQPGTKSCPRNQKLEIS